MKPDRAGCIKSVTDTVRSTNTNLTLEKEHCMVRKKDIRAGKCYVNDARTIAREVVEVRDQVVTFQTYHLDTGNSCGSPSECPTRNFTHWAAYEVPITEIVHPD
jgi:hypothetical protein